MHPLMHLHTPAGLLATAGWDGKLCYWDPRAPPSSGPLLSVALPGKCYSLTATSAHVIAATSARRLVIFNLNRCELVLGGGDLRGWSVRERPSGAAYTHTHNQHTHHPHTP
jgi:hypothetical protein